MAEDQEIETVLPTGAIIYKDGSIKTPAGTIVKPKPTGELSSNQKSNPNFPDTGQAQQNTRNDLANEVKKRQNNQ